MARQTVSSIHSYSDSGGYVNFMMDDVDGSRLKAINVSFSGQPQHRAYDKLTVELK